MSGPERREAMTPELLPCPHCGSANVKTFRHVHGQDAPCVMCRGCYASTTSVTKWNRRAPLSTAVLAGLPEVNALVAAETERCAKIAEHFRDMCGECHWPEDAVIAGGNVANDIAAAIREASNG